MNKTRLLTKKFMLACVLAIAMVASTIMGLSVINTAKAADASDDVYFGNFTVTGGTLQYDTARIHFSYSDAGAITVGSVGNPDVTKEYPNRGRYKNINTLIVEFGENGGTFRFHKPIDASAKMITLAPIAYQNGESVDGSSYASFAGLNYYVDLGDVSRGLAGYDSANYNFVSIRTETKGADEYFVGATRPAIATYGGAGQGFGAIYASNGAKVSDGNHRMTFSQSTGELIPNGSNLVTSNIYASDVGAQLDGNWSKYMGKGSQSLLMDYGMDGTKAVTNHVKMWGPGETGASGVMTDGFNLSGGDPIDSSWIHSNAAPTEIWDLSKKYNGTAAGDNWEGLAAEGNYVELRTFGACAFAITNIGDYDLTDLDDEAYAEPADPQTYENFSATGTMAYGMYKVQDSSPVGMYGELTAVKGLKVDLASENDVFTFSKPATIVNGKISIDIAPVWNEYKSTIDSEDCATILYVTIADASGNKVVIRHSLASNGAVYTMATHSGLLGNEKITQKYMNGSSRPGGELADTSGQNVSVMNFPLLQRLNYDNGKVTVDRLKTLGGEVKEVVGGAVVAVNDMTNETTWGTEKFAGFNGDKVYVSVQASKAQSFVISTVGEYNLADSNDAAYKSEIAAAIDGLLTMKEGASIRYNEGTSGIRFETLIDADKKVALDALKTASKIDSYSFGTIIVPFDYLTDNNNPTHDTLDAGTYYDLPSTYVSGESFKGSLVGIKAENYDRQWIGRGYVKVVVGGVATYYYADYSADNARSVYEVAIAEYNEKEIAGLNADQVAVLKGYIDGVVVLNAQNELVDKGVDYDEPYSVSVDAGVITITANTGVVIKSVVIDGVQVDAVIAADGSTATVTLA